MTRLARLCEHDEVGGHYVLNGQVIIWLGGRENEPEFCLGGAFLPDDTLIIGKVDGEWPEWMEESDKYVLDSIVDALNETEKGDVVPDPLSVRGLALSLTIREAEALRSMAHWVMDEQADALLTPGESESAFAACRKIEDALSAAVELGFLDALSVREST